MKSIHTLLVLLLVATTPLFAKEGEKNAEKRSQAEIYSEKAEKMRDKAAKAEAGEAETYTRIAENYDRMSAIKREAEAKSAKGEMMDWSEYHRIQGETRKMEMALRKDKVTDKKDHREKIKDKYPEKHSEEMKKEAKEKAMEKFEKSETNAKDKTGEVVEEVEKPQGFQIKTKVGY